MTHHTTTVIDDQADQPALSDQLRFDTLSGFQRDILRGLYATRAWPHNEGVTAGTLRELLTAYPNYEHPGPSTSRFYPTTNRLADRDWLTIQHDTTDARRRHYHLTMSAKDLLDAVTTAEHHLHTTTPQPPVLTDADHGGHQ